jgi:hypothetical protein
VIVEGHYTGHPSIFQYIDYNLLLLSSKNELLKRKINRVKNYRDPNLTKKYFELIDIPSFINFVSRYGNNYSLLVDNTNYNNPQIKKLEYIKKWVNEVDKVERYKKQNLKYEDLYNEIKFTELYGTQGLDFKNFNEIFNFIEKLDNFIIKNFRLAIKDIKLSTSNFIKSN